MRIAIDARAWAWTGIGRYIRALVHEYAQMDTPHTFILLIPNTPEVLKSAEEAIADSPTSFEIESVDGSYYSLREHITFPLALSKIKADLFHFPNFNIPLTFSRPYVVTIHDITRLYFPGQKHTGIIRQAIYELVFSHAVARAKKVICVSNNTALELAAMGINSHAKPVVIHEAVDTQFTEAPDAVTRTRVRELLGTNTPYLLMVGVWMNHKNIPRALAALKILREEFPSLKLVCTGGYKPGYVNVPDLAASLELSDSVILPGFVPDDLLPALYAESTALLFASLYEGFGLPALEAAALGVPVVAAQGSSLPEVMGEAAQYVNPESAEDIAGGIRKVLQNEDRKQVLIKAGRSRASTFNWRTCANETIEVYESLAS